MRREFVFIAFRREDGIQEDAFLGDKEVTI
jgi:hypothetical protein